MSQVNFRLSIDEVVNLLGLEKDPRTRPGASSYNVRCPFCGSLTESEYKMNINLTKNAYSCVRCSMGQEGTGVLDLYSRVRLGEKYIKGPNGNERRVLKAMREEYEGLPIERKPVAHKDLPKIEDILPASDSDLNAAYSALLSLPYLALTDKHRKNLIDRGLNDEVISRNNYASIPSVYEDDAWYHNNPKYPDARGIYFNNNLRTEQNKFPTLKDIPDERIIAGMVIANDIRSQNISLKGVPGFFTLKNYWVFKVTDSGILIPTRNNKGAIVGLQLRRDHATSGAKYLTISSKDYSNGVTTNICRTHFPLGNCDIRDAKTAKVYLTEGPLKADVCSALLDEKDEKTFFMAIPGVNNTNQLPGIAKVLKAKGVTNVNIALDMDKLVNPYVANAGVKIRKIFTDEGIGVRTLVWDYEEYLSDFDLQVADFCQLHNVDITEIESNPSPFYRIPEYVKRIKEANDDLLKEFRKQLPWPGAKGLDDYLLQERLLGLTSQF